MQETEGDHAFETCTLREPRFVLLESWTVLPDDRSDTELELDRLPYIQNLKARCKLIGINEYGTWFSLSKFVNIFHVAQTHGTSVVLLVLSRLFLCLFVCLSICLSVCLSVHLSIYLSMCLIVCLSVYLSVCLFVCLFVCLSICLSVCLLVCPFVCLFVYLSVCLSVGILFVCLSVYCLSMCLSVDVSSTVCLRHACATNYQFCLSTLQLVIHITKLLSHIHFKRHHRHHNQLLHLLDPDVVITNSLVRHHLHQYFKRMHLGTQQKGKLISTRSSMSLHHTFLTIYSRHNTLCYPITLITSHFAKTNARHGNHHKNIFSTLRKAFTSTLRTCPHPISHSVTHEL